MNLCSIFNFYTVYKILLKINIPHCQTLNIYSEVCFFYMLYKILLKNNIHCLFSRLRASLKLRNCTSIYFFIYILRQILYQLVFNSARYFTYILIYIYDIQGTISLLFVMNLNLCKVPLFFGRFKAPGESYCQREVSGCRILIFISILYNINTVNKKKLKRLLISFLCRSISLCNITFNIPFKFIVIKLKYHGKINKT